MKFSKSYLYLVSLALLGIIIGIYLGIGHHRQYMINNNVNYASDASNMHSFLLHLLGLDKKYNSLYDYYINGAIEISDALSMQSMFRYGSLRHELRTNLIEKAKTQKLSRKEFNYICDFEIYNNNGKIQIWDKFRPSLAIEVIAEEPIFYGIPSADMTRNMYSDSCFKNNF